MSLETRARCYRIVVIYRVEIFILPKGVVGFSKFSERHCLNFWCWIQNRESYIARILLISLVLVAQKYISFVLPISRWL